MNHYELIKQVNKEMMFYHEIWIKYVLENFATPPIKGEITKGKLKWRGIKICVQNSYIDGTKEWIEQRGVKIGNEFIIEPFF